MSRIIETKIIIGTEDNYLRKFDVILQTKLARNDVKILETFDDFTNELIKSIDENVGC